MPPYAKYALVEDAAKRREQSQIGSVLATALQTINPRWTLARPPSPNTLFTAAESLADAKKEIVPSAVAQSPRSPWLTNPQVHEKVPIKRRIDPLNVPEALGIVEPTWLPYATPPPSRNSQRSSKNPSGQKPALHQWSSRHHVCDSKDNRRLPKLQRAYFDDLPQTRCQGGVYKMVAGHRSFNFDQFCASPAHIQQQDLHRHFDRYPFLEYHDDNLLEGGLSQQGTLSKSTTSAFEIPRASSSLSSCESDDLGLSPVLKTSKDAGDCSLLGSLADAHAQPDNGNFNDAQFLYAEGRIEANSIACSKVETTPAGFGLADCSKVTTAWIETRQSQGQRSPVSPANSVRKCFGREPTLANDTCQCEKVLIVDAKFCRLCGKRRQVLADTQCDEEEGSLIAFPSSRGSSSTLQSPRGSLIGLHNPLRAASSALSPKSVAFSPTVKQSKSGGRFQRKRDSTEAWRCSVFAKGGIPQFHTWCESKFGSLAKLWRCIDSHNHMRIGLGQFSRALQDLGYSGDARELFKSLNRDQTGTLSFYHFAPQVALGVADLLTWARCKYGSLAEVGLMNAVDQRSFISRQQFVNLCKKKGYSNEESMQHTYDLIDKDGDGSVVRTEVAHLDKWEFPEWLIAKPDEKAAEACKSKLLFRCNGNALLAWRHMNPGGSMRVSWNDFKHACRKLLTQEDCQDLPAAWRVLDNDLSGWLSLREFNREAHDKLISFMDWTHDNSADSILASFPKLMGTSAKDAKMSLAEFRHVCKQSTLGDDVVTFIFEGLDADLTGKITASELRFLDEWKAAADLREEEAWAQITQKSAFKKAGSLVKMKSFQRKTGHIGCLGMDRHRRHSIESQKSVGSRKSKERTSGMEV